MLFDYFIRQVDMKPGEVLTSIFIPYTQEQQFVEAYKQSRRREDDIAIVNGALNVILNEQVCMKAGVQLNMPF